MALDLVGALLSLFATCRRQEDGCLTLLSRPQEQRGDHNKSAETEPRQAQAEGMGRSEQASALAAVTVRDRREAWTGWCSTRPLNSCQDLAACCSRIKADICRMPHERNQISDSMGRGLAGKGTGRM